MLSKPEHRSWRNKFYDDVVGSKLQAIVAFGGEAQAALRLWTPRPSVPVFEVPHPSSRDASRLVAEWRQAVSQLRAIVTPDPDGDPTLPNYGSRFQEADYARIPGRDLPFGIPAWYGDDSSGRKDKPRHNNSVSRPGYDLKHTLIWRAPRAGALRRCTAAMRSSAPI